MFMIGSLNLHIPLLTYDWNEIRAHVCRHVRGHLLLKLKRTCFLKHLGECLLFMIMVYSNNIQESSVSINVWTRLPCDVEFKIYSLLKVLLLGKPSHLFLVSISCFSCTSSFFLYPIFSPRSPKIRECTISPVLCFISLLLYADLMLKCVYCRVW